MEKVGESDVQLHVSAEMEAYGDQAASASNLAYFVASLERATCMSWCKIGKVRQVI